jgi:hypothetical protein
MDEIIFGDSSVPLKPAHPKEDRLKSHAAQYVEAIAKI